MSTFRKFTAAFSILMGIAMITWWTSFLATNQMPEMGAEPITALLHVIAEFVTGFSLIVAGWALLTDRQWARQAFLIATGMLTYAMIQVVGYMAQRGETATVFMFVTFFIVALILIANNQKLETAV